MNITSDSVRIAMNLGAVVTLFTVILFYWLFLKEPKKK